MFACDLAYKLIFLKSENLVERFTHYYVKISLQTYLNYLLNVLDYYKHTCQKNTLYIQTN
jgi:hypothetical protein